MVNLIFVEIYHTKGFVRQLGVKKIKKNQVSTNDGGFYSSVANFHTDDELVFLFHDNLKNYDESGSFINDNNRFYPTS
jgi:hypothetical protein